MTGTKNNQKIKICYITTISLTIHSFFVPQLQYLSHYGYEMSVVCSEDKSLPQKLGKDIRYHAMPIPRGLSLVGSFRAIRQLTALFRMEKFDMIQYSTPNAALYASIAGVLAGTPIRNYHLMGFRYLGSGGIGKQILKRLETLACRCSTSIECVSLSNLELGVKERIFEPSKAIMVWNGSSGGVDLKRFDVKKRPLWRQQIRDELGILPDDYVMSFVGRITRDKGINEILKAYFDLQTEAKLLFVGSEEGMDTLDSNLLQKARESQQIFFLGNVADVERYYAASDVLLLPSYREGFGNVIVEAAAMGTPAIVSNIPGPIDAIVPGKTALVVEPRRVDQLQAAMVSLLKKTTVLYAEDCVEFVRTHFDGEILVQKILERKLNLLGG